MSSSRMAEVDGHLLARVRLTLFDLLRPLFHMLRHFQEGAGDIIAEAKRYLTDAKCTLPQVLCRFVHLGFSGLALVTFRYP